MAKSLASILSRKNQSPLDSIMRRANKINQLEAEVRAQLDSHLADFVKVASFEEGVLLLFTDSGSKLTALTFEKKALIANLQEKPEFKSLSEVQIRVDPSLF